MRSDWTLPICTGRERLRLNGQKAHATQKPEALLYRVLLASSNPGDVVLDPFFGTGTTGVVAQRLNRRWIGIERDPQYVALARERIAALLPTNGDPRIFASHNPRRETRLPFGALLENNLLQPGDKLYFGERSAIYACVQADGSLEYNGQRGSIHKIARSLHPGPCNGWQLWFYEDAGSGERRPIDLLRQQLRDLFKSSNEGKK
jgi:modification methylase